MRDSVYDTPFSVKRDWKSLKICTREERGMTAEENAKKIKALITEQLGIEEEEVVSEAKFIDVLGADSLDTVELIMAFEETFDIEIPDEDAEKITTVQEAIDYVVAKVEENA